MADEIGWVIERYVHSTLHYWNGDDSGFPWSTDNSNAVRFAREIDANVVLAHYCDGIGRVAEHKWIEESQ